jgi:hypothetical protein
MTIAWAQTPKGHEPHGRSRRIPTPRVLHRQTTSVANRWEAALGIRLRRPSRFGNSTRSPPEGTPAGPHSFGRENPKGGFVAANPASVGGTASRTHHLSRFGSRSGEARCELFACTPSFGRVCGVEPRLRPTSDSPRPRFEPSGFGAKLGSLSTAPKTRPHTFGCVNREPGTRSNVACRSVTLPRKTTGWPQRSGIRD